MRLESRDRVPPWAVPLTPLAAVAAAFLICAPLVAWAGASVGEAYALVFKSSLGSRFGLTETLARATPLVFTGLAVAVAFRAKLWNIGAEGQFYMGTVAATLLGTGALGGLPAPLLVCALFLAGALAGGVALLVPAILKSRHKVDEVVTTLLLNFVIILFVSYLLEGPLKDPMSLGWPQAAPVVDEGRLPVLAQGTRLHLGFAVALALAVAVWALMSRSVLGFEIRAVGHNPAASRFAGIRVNSTLAKTALISGGLAGMGGVSEVIGLKGYLTLDISPGFGYAGIAVAMLALLHPLGVVVSAVFLSAVFVGADSMSRAIAVPSYLADVIVACSILLALAGTVLSRYRLVRG